MTASKSHPLHFLAVCSAGILMLGSAARAQTGGEPARDGRSSWALDVEPMFMGSTAKIAPPGARDTAFVPVIYEAGTLRAVHAVSDSLLVAPHVDATCLVIRSFSTPRKTLTRALRALSEIQCQPVGTVFNFMPTGTGSCYYYSGRYYGSCQSKGVYGAS